MTLRIRSGVAADATTLAALAALTFPLATPSDTRPDAIADFVATTLSAERFVEHLTDPGRLVLVAEVADEPVGYALLIVGAAGIPPVYAALRPDPDWRAASPRTCARRRSAIAGRSGWSSGSTSRSSTSVMRAQPFARAQRNSGWTSMSWTQPCMKSPGSRLNIRRENWRTCFTASS